MLEDDFTWVIRKALRGHEMDAAEAAARAGLETAAVDALLAGRFDAAAARAVAPALGLDAQALATHPHYEPPPSDHPAVHRLDLPFGGERVNAWLIDTREGRVLIDTGCTPGELSDALRPHGGIPAVRLVIITHNHRDHVGGLEAATASGAPVFGPGAGMGWQELPPGDGVTFGGLAFEACDLAGHADPALGVRIDGLDGPVLAVGDALFAGSIGGCAGKHALATALRTLSSVLRGLPAHTLLLPGHGPPTRLDAESRHNPFLTWMLDPGATPQ